MRYPYDAPFPVSGPVRHEAATLLETGTARVGQSVEVYSKQTCRCGQVFHGYDTGADYGTTIPRAEAKVTEAMVKHTSLHNAAVS